MPTQTEYVDNVLNELSGFVPSDDFRLTPAQILFWIEYYKDQLILQATDYGQDLPGELWIDTGIWQVHQVDKAETPAFLFGKSIVKTVNKVPKRVQFPLLRGLWVGSTDKQTPFIPATPNNARYKVANSFASAEGMKWFWELGEYIYVAQDECSDTTGLKYINLRLVPHSPSDCPYYNGDGTGRDYNPDTDLYPMPDSIVSTIVQMILTKEFGLGSQVRPDVTENAEDNTAFIFPRGQRRS
jgi:hypothetical protein